MIRRHHRLKVVDFFLKSVEGQQPNSGWELSRFNLYVAVLHISQFLIVCVMIGVYFSVSDNKSFPFVAGTQKLHMTSQAIVPSDEKINQCVKDNSEAENRLTMLIDYTNKSSVLDTNIYDFSNVIIYEYYEIGGLSISTPGMICAFFLLSGLFQLMNGLLLSASTDRPRLLHYVEYSITGSMCLVVMAVNLGISEITAITGLFGLFFGMNMLGACAELLVFAAEKFKDVNQPRKDVAFPPLLDQNNLWVVAHVSSWILFLISMGAVLAQYHNLRYCSERTTPDYVIATVVIEMLAFLSFGFVQKWGLLKRMKLLYDNANLSWPFEWYLGFFQIWYNIFTPSSAPDTRVEAVYFMDLWMILLSLLAKTFLAWLLMAPALAAKIAGIKEPQWVMLTSPQTV